MRELGKNEYNKSPKFKIPIDAPNSSFTGSNPKVTGGDSGCMTRDTSYGVLVTVNMLKNGKEKELVKLCKFVNRMFIPEK